MIQLVTYSWNDCNEEMYINLRPGLFEFHKQLSCRFQIYHIARISWYGGFALNHFRKRNIIMDVSPCKGLMTVWILYIEITQNCGQAFGIDVILVTGAYTV